MDSTQATRTCGQCHKEVAEANFALHVTHCSRFLCLCPDCEEAVPRDQLDQHRQEEHTLVRCSKCHKKLERCQLLDHESDECMERLQSCQYCELELPWKELDEHRVACGSRTELCRDCGRYVTLRDQAQHGLTCSASASDDGPGSDRPQAASKPADIKKRCNTCMASFPAEDIKKHELTCAAASGFGDGEESEEDEGDLSPYPGGVYTASSLGAGGGPRGDGGGGGAHMDGVDSCPHCHLALPRRTLLWHEGKCKIHLLLRMSESRGKAGASAAVNG